MKKLLFQPWSLWKIKIGFKRVVDSGFCRNSKTLQKEMFLAQAEKRRLTFKLWSCSHKRSTLIEFLEPSDYENICKSSNLESPATWKNNLQTLHFFVDL